MHPEALGTISASHLRMLHEEEKWKLDECVSECDKQDSNTQNDVVKSTKVKARGKCQLKNKLNQIRQRKDQEEKF